ncbi:MAG TPA: ribokinase [Acidimicrobiales bacterium]|jgi:ribokinase|nr:ribokinase [Acidimicrobiales bacterium]
MPGVLVAGSINMDIVASVPRLPTPGETVTGTGLRFVPGGKGANQAVAAVRAGAAVTLVGAVGDDIFAGDLLSFLGRCGVDVGAVARRPRMPTGTALVTVAADGENAIVVIPGANGTLDEASVREPGARPGDVLVTQYETPIDAAIAFFRRGREAGATCVLNPAPAAPTPSDLLALVDVLVLNEIELAELSGVALAPDAADDDIAGAIARLRNDGFAGLGVATLGARGALAVSDGAVRRVPAHRVRAVDTTGAGDCFVGVLAAELVGGSPIDAALARANAAAALCVTRAGAGPSMPTRREIDAFVGQPATEK